jgi:hypothetical protein
MFQLIIKVPIAKPTNKVLKKFTLLKYSGAKKRELAPNFSKKLPLIVAKRIYQNIKKT